MASRSDALWKDQERLSMAPNRRPVMYQRWSHLTFLHWPVPTDLLQGLVPPELEIDTHDGQAYIGLVPFTMSGIRPIALPALPGLSAFHETNVRTYVHRSGREPGVWFFSLEAANRIAVQIARRWFGLPYFHADMRIEIQTDHLGYHSNRIEGRVKSEVEVRRRGEFAPAAPRTLEYFLIERYLLYSQHQGRLKSGVVAHQPYTFCPAVATRVQDDLISAAGIEVLGVPPLVHYSPGIDVRVFGLQAVNPSV